jgi:hypothetical protein
MKSFFVSLLFLIGFVNIARADVLFVADEFPAMQLVADKLKDAEKINSKVVAQNELPENLSSFETVVVYIHGALSEKAESAFISYTTNGGKLVVLHHSISSGKRKNANWFSFLGVSLLEKDVSEGGYKWIDKINWELVNLNPTHFIMTNKVTYPTNISYVITNSVERRLPGFSLANSEVYLNHVHTEPRTLLMGFKYTDAPSGKTYMQDRAGWIKSAGKGQIIYLMPGHTVGDFENSAYGRIVLNAVIYKK